MKDRSLTTPPEPSPDSATPDGPLSDDIRIRRATAADAPAIHALMRPYVMQHLLLSRTEAEIIELTQHGYVAAKVQADQEVQLVGFAAIEIYSPKLAELQCLAVHQSCQGTGVGRTLVGRCVERARSAGVMEVMAISSSENFLRSCGFDFALPDQKKAMFFQLRPRPSQ